MIQLPLHWQANWVYMYDAAYKFQLICIVSSREEYVFLLQRVIFPDGHARL